MYAYVLLLLCQVIIKWHLNHNCGNFKNPLNGFSIPFTSYYIKFVTLNNILFPRVKIRNWPLFFERSSTTFLSVLLSSLSTQERQVPGGRGGSPPPPGFEKSQKLGGPPPQFLDKIMLTWNIF